MSFFNTTAERGADLREYQVKACSQEARVLEWFTTAAEFLYTPSQIRSLVFRDTVPLTSVRRAMTNLTTKNLLARSEKKRKGPYGRPEFCWYRKGASAQRELFCLGS